MVTVHEATAALRSIDFSDLLARGEGTVFAVILDGEPVVATVVALVEKEDEDNDRDLAVVVKLGSQYFKRIGWGMIGSHCYGEYESSWSSEVTEVHPRETVVTVYDVV